MKNFKKLMVGTLIMALSNVSTAIASDNWVKCAGPAKAYPKETFQIQCTSGRNINGAKAHLQWFNGQTWVTAKAGDYLWDGSLLIFWRVYNDPKYSGTDRLRVVTEKIDNLVEPYPGSISNEFQVTVIPDGTVSPSNSSSTTSSNKVLSQKPKTVTIPNLVGVSVKWVKAHPNYFPGVHMIITGSSCSISDLLSGSAVIIDQRPNPMQLRPYNAIVTLQTNC